MAFVVAVVLTLAFELLAPFGAIAFVALRIRPRITHVWATGLGGAIAGAALFYLVILVRRSLPDHGFIGVEGAALVKRAVADAAVVAIAEEIVRFAAALWLFRKASAKSPLVAAAMFGLGWGGFECVRVGLMAANELLPALEYASADKPLPFLPLTGAFERASAMVLHVALSAFAVKFATEVEERSYGMAALLFAAALFIHFALDALVGWYGIPARRAFEHDDYDRGLRWLLTMECWFAAGAIATLSLASRLSSSLGESRAPVP